MRSKGRSWFCQQDGKHPRDGHSRSIPKPGGGAELGLRGHKTGASAAPATQCQDHSSGTKTSRIPRSLVLLIPVSQDFPPCEGEAGLAIVAEHHPRELALLGFPAPPTIPTFLSRELSSGAHPWNTPRSNVLSSAISSFQKQLHAVTHPRSLPPKKGMWPRATAALHSRDVEGNPSPGIAQGTGQHSPTTREAAASRGEESAPGAAPAEQKTGISSWFLGCQQINPSTGSVSLQKRPRTGCGNQGWDTTPLVAQHNISGWFWFSPLWQQEAESRIRVGCPEASSLCPWGSQDPKAGLQSSIRVPAGSFPRQGEEDEPRSRSRGGAGNSQVPSSPSLRVLVSAHGAAAAHPSGITSWRLHGGGQTPAGTR